LKADGNDLKNGKADKKSYTHLIPWLSTA